MSSVSLWLTRLSRHIGIYAAGSIVSVLVGLVSVAVVTRFMPPSGFGQLGILMAFATLLTIVYDMGIMQGTFRRTFGQTDEGDDGGEGDDGIDVAEEVEAGVRDKRRALGAGVSLCMMIATFGTIIIAIASPELADLLIGNRGDASLVVLAAALGSTGAVWRMTWNVVRLERRPTTYVVLGCVRPFLMTGGAIAFLAAGGGVGGVLAGNAIGSGASVLMAIGSSWRSYRLNIDFGAFGQTFRIARRWIPMIIAFWIIHNGDTILLSRFVSDHDVGLYRFATRIGGTFSFYVGAVMNAWNPLRRTPMFVAARQARGMAIGADLIFYYWLVGVWLLVTLTAAAAVLAKLGPPAYGAAAGLIPLSGASFVLYGGYMTVYRGSRYAGRSQWHVGITVIAALVFVGVTILLAPSLGAYGVAIAPLAGFIVALLITGWQSQHGANPLPIRYRGILAMVGVGAVCVVLSEVVAPLTGSFEVPLRIAAVLLYPVGIVGLRILPFSQVREIAGLVRSAANSRGGNDELRERLARLAPADRDTLELVLRHKNLSAAAEALPPAERPGLPRRLGSVLCRLTDVTSYAQRDPRIAYYAFGAGVVAERDLIARELMADESIEPQELARIEDVAMRLRRLPVDTWPPPEELPVAMVEGTELDDEEIEALAERPRALGGSDDGGATTNGAGTNGAGGGARGRRWAASSCYGGVALADPQPEEPTEPDAGADADEGVVLDGPAPPPEPPEGWVVAPPDFVGIGAGRAGTTRWFDLVVAHPQVRAPISTRKELHFFDRFYDGSATRQALAEYEHYFPRPPGELSGEWSGYMRDFWTPRLIKRAAPEAKLLVSLRDPVERYLSELARARRRRGQEREVRPIALSDMANRGLYFQQLRRVMRFFDAEHILVLQYEACVEDPERELRRTYEFLGLDYVDPGAEAMAAHPNLGRNRDEYELPAALRPDLVGFFRADMRSLVRQFPHVDLRLWPNFS